MKTRLDTDTVVVGLGAMGSQTLWRLARDGVDAIGVERFAPGHDRGSSHGESRIIRTAYLEGAEYVPFVRAAWRAWDELQEAAQARLVIRSGALMLGRPDSAAVDGSTLAAREHGLACTRLVARELAERHPRHLMRPDEVGVFEEDAGVVLPEPAILAAVRLAREAGARVLTQRAVTRIEPDADHPRVWVGDTEIRARRVVVTAGAWMPRLLPGLADLGGGIRVERRVLGWFPITAPPTHTAGPEPVFARDEPDGTLWYGFPSMDGGRTLKIGVHAESAEVRTAERPRPGAQWGEPVDPDLGPRPPDADDAARLGALAAGLRGVGPLPERMVACMYTMTPDEHFLIGHHDALPGLVLAGGFSGHGFKFASAVGVALADLARDGHTELPIGMFDPHRWDTDGPRRP
ncbi:N-methyl-L-tryptophan oxidase [Nocardiopsis sp. MG754419]|uniref:N-methyl-L-tryptophan oxidase n=1 Tax=Nocardiopsis sp. MG754419 TaxID=2259865 RepID=UPI001BAD7322|nr:N-methyl-L-tryptophan oxidase [Nocardiopsis sp. MG754419]MBR8744679.1 N-methyl-L-tryptophan oxidase [Nocardiopsis sp. MG754419]